jgi:hypothetical protein
MLGSFRMSVDDCLKEYEEISHNKFRKSRLISQRPKYSARVMEQAYEQVKARQSDDVGVCVRLGTRGVDFAYSACNEFIAQSEPHTRITKIQYQDDTQSSGGEQVPQLHSNDWQPKDWSKAHDGRSSTTLHDIRHAFEAWTLDDSNTKQMKACASELVARRRARATDIALWDRFRRRSEGSFMRHREHPERKPPFHSDPQVESCHNEEQVKQSCSSIFNKISQEGTWSGDSQNPKMDDVLTAPCPVVETLYSLPEDTTLDTSIQVNSKTQCLEFPSTWGCAVDVTPSKGGCVFWNYGFSGDKLLLSRPRNIHALHEVIGLSARFRSGLSTAAFYQKRVKRCTRPLVKRHYRRIEWQCVSHSSVNLKLGCRD